MEMEKNKNKQKTLFFPYLQINAVSSWNVWQ